MSELISRMILEGIPENLPEVYDIPGHYNRAPKRPCPLNDEEKKLALRNALRYFPKALHKELAAEFLAELETHGHIYMYRYRPQYEIKARNYSELPHNSVSAACIMLMILNNLDEAVAQHPAELVTYGGNGAVFQNWAQYRLTMKYLAELSDEQTLVLYSGHPLGVFPSQPSSPRLVVTNGMMVPNYSTVDQLNRLNALGVTQYGQMTAGSFMYIGPQGIVHGTTITVLNAGRMQGGSGLAGKLFVTAGLGGMSGAQAKAGVIAGAVTVVAEVNEKAITKRHEQGWLDEIYNDLGELLDRVEQAKANKEAVSLGYLGNVVDLWEFFVEREVGVDLGSDQTSLHNPHGGGYYPVGVTIDEANELIANDQEKFKQLVSESLKRQVAAINKLSEQGMYFFDYGNAFLLEASRAKADVLKSNGEFRYPSYVQDIMGPLCFDYGFGPFRWVCCSGDEKDLETTDRIAQEVLTELASKATDDISQQLKDNVLWIEQARQNKLVVGSQARILYANSEGRARIAEAFNQAVSSGEVSAPIVLGRDHHDVSGTDSPYRETANIYDGSNLCADMAVQNVIGDSFRGATWVSIHNGGGVGWGEVINGGFGLVLDGSEQASKRAKQMLFWDVNNGIARRAWARNPGAIDQVQRAMESEDLLSVTMPELVDDEVIENLV